MQKFRAVVSQRTSDAVVAQLHEAGVVQLKEISELEVTRKALGEEVYEISSLLTKFKEIQEFLKARKYGRPVRVKELAYERILKDAKKLLSRLEPKLNILRVKNKELSGKKQKLLAQREVIENFRAIKFPLKYLRSTDEIYVVVGQIAEERAPEFSRSARDALADRVFVSSVGKGKMRIVIVACRTKDQLKLSPLLYRYEVEILELPPMAEVPRKALKLIEKRLAEVEKQAAGADRKVKKLAKAEAQKINCLTELLEIQKERLECGAIFGYTDATVLVEGWAPTKKISELKAILNKTTRRRYVFRAYDPQPAEVEKIPIELENPKVVKDFEFVTGMYGLPKYDEVDPTPFLSITFALFFAICLSDAGYGLVLGLFMASGLWFAKSFPWDLRRMLIVCAIFTVVIGALLGGWFGKGPLWVNPLENPIPILKLAVFIGILHIILAFGVVAALKDVFRKDWKNLILNHIPRVLIVVGFFGLSFCALGIGLREFGINFAFPKMNLFEAFNPFAPAVVIVVAFRIMFYIGLGVGMAGAALMARGLREKFSGPINVVYSITGLVADAASYSRLMALGIATSIIAYAINYIIGWLYGGLSPKLSAISVVLVVPLLVVLAVVFIVGHCFNIFINALGGFIHTMRLHYVEFFGKFYEGGGEKFVPFKAKRMFTKV
jgi:V/A-type H+-transporting ATPase subunit I